MNERIRGFERLSGLEIYGLGAKRDRWETTMEKFTELVLADIIAIIEDPKTYNRCVFTNFDASQALCVAQELVKEIRQQFKDVK